jgi:hypothetical protein
LILEGFISFFLYACLFPQHLKQIEVDPSSLCYVFYSTGACVPEVTEHFVWRGFLCEEILIYVTYEELEIRFSEPEWHKHTGSLHGLGHFSSLDYHSFILLFQ